MNPLYDPHLSTSPWPRRCRRAAGASLLALLAACGGGGGSDADNAGGGDGDPPTGTAPGGLYVGYYAEDPSSNPEDPTIGALHLRLPANDAPFSGAMYFTYVGCQTSNVGAISGSRRGDALNGNWRGTVDGLLQSGPYEGSYGAGAGSFTGDYVVTGGKQRVTVAGCIDYYIAPNGTWELLPVSASQPSSFRLATSGTTVSWTNPDGTALTLVAVIDEALALAGEATATRYQVLGESALQQLDLTTVADLSGGTRYVVTVATVSDTGERLSASSTVLSR